MKPQNELPQGGKIRRVASEECASLTGSGGDKSSINNNGIHGVIGQAPWCSIATGTEILRLRGGGDDPNRPEKNQSKQKKGSEQKLTINFSDLTEEQIKLLSANKDIVRRQSLPRSPPRGAGAIPRKRDREQVSPGVHVDRGAKRRNAQDIVEEETEEVFDEEDEASGEESDGDTDPYGRMVMEFNRCCDKVATATSRYEGGRIQFNRAEQLEVGKSLNDMRKLFSSMAFELGKIAKAQQAMSQPQADQNLEILNELKQLRIEVAEVKRATGLPQTQLRVPQRPPKQVQPHSPELYSEVASGPKNEKMKNEKRQAPPKSARQKNSLSRILVKAAAGDTLKDSEAIKSQLLTELKGNESLKIRNIRKLRDSTVVVEMPTPEDLQALTEGLKNSANLALQEPSKIRPRVVVYDLPKDVDEEFLISQIVNKNLTIPPTEKGEVKVVFKMKASNPEKVNVVLSLTGNYFKQAIRAGRLYVGFGSHRVREFKSITRCYKCQGYGHTAKVCSKEDVICGHCAEPGHSFKECPKKGEAAICCNCKSKKKDHNHAVTDKNCSEYKRNVEMYMGKIDYG